MTTCPTSGAIVPTGHRSPTLNLDTLEGPLAFRCPVCQEVHSWTRKQAHVEKTVSLADLRNRAA